MCEKEQLAKRHEILAEKYKKISGIIIEQASILDIEVDKLIETRLNNRILLMDYLFEELLSLNSQYVQLSMDTVRYVNARNGTAYYGEKDNCL